MTQWAFSLSLSVVAVVMLGTTVCPPQVLVLMLLSPWAVPVGLAEAVTMSRLAPLAISKRTVIDLTVFLPRVLATGVVTVRPPPSVRVGIAPLPGTILRVVMGKNRLAKAFSLRLVLPALKAALPVMWSSVQRAV